MAQRASQRPTVQFNKGLITEAGELTFPEGASVDELNMSLERDGSRKRRLGVQYETGYVLDQSASVSDQVATSTTLWENAGTVAGLTFVVVQLGKTLHFYSEQGGALSPNKEQFTLDLTSFLRPNAASAADARIQTTSIQGKLIVSSKELNTFVVTYDKDAGTITPEAIKFRIRDFEWQGDVAEYEENVSSGNLTDAREYDTQNAGWKGDNGIDALTAFETANTAYPALTLPWYSGKNSNGDFSVVEWEKVFVGTTLIANGSYTYDLYNMDRVTASGLAGVENYIEQTRFSSVAAYSGRIFYAGMGGRNTSNIFFSKLIQQDKDFGECLQVNDPTSEGISDLLDTDGGFINIPDAYNIKRLHVLGSQLVIFAENGVWAIRGIDNVFTATAYSVIKIADNGLTYDGSFVAQEGGRPYWWSSTGIHSLGASAEQQTLTEINISLTTIQKYFNDIRPEKRALVRSAYDAFNNRVAWFYPANDETEANKVSNILWFDEGLNAFYPWKIADGATGQYVLGAFFTKGNATTNIEFTVVDSQDRTVVDSNGNTVVVTRSGAEYTSSALRMLVRDANGQVTFAEFTNSDFKDWGTTDYMSYAEGGYNFLGDLSRKKKVIYFTSYFAVTEENIQGNETIGYTFSRPSGCLVSTYWDFRSSPSQMPQQAYRLKELPVPSGTGFLQYPNSVTTSRLRLRGGGRSMRFRFESQSGKDFHLLGFDSITGSNPR